MMTQMKILNRDSIQTPLKGKSRPWVLLSIVAFAAFFGIAYHLAGSDFLDSWTGSKTQISSTPRQGESSPPFESGDVSGGQPKGRSVYSAEFKRRIEKLKAEFLSAQRLQDPSEQNTALERCLAGLSPEAAAVLLAAMSPDELSGNASQRLFDLWATADPKIALTWAESMTDSATRQSFMNVAAIRWATKNFTEAVEWARSLSQGYTRSEILASIAQEALGTHPNEVLRFARELPEGPASTELIARASGAWANQDRDGAVKWARDIQDANLRQQVFEQIAIAAAAKDLQAGANIALNEMELGIQQDRALVTIAQQWAREDPEMASSWIRQFPDDYFGQDAAEALISTWAWKDLAAAGNWLSSLPNSRLRNRAILAYARILRHSDIPSAERWESSITHIP